MVSQTNPWVVPFLDKDDGFEVFNYEKKFNFWKILKNLLFSELKHRINQVSFFLNKKLLNFNLFFFFFFQIKNLPNFKLI